MTTPSFHDTRLISSMFRVSHRLHVYTLVCGCERECVVVGELPLLRVRACVRACAGRGGACVCVALATAEPLMVTVTVTITVTLTRTRTRTLTLHFEGVADRHAGEQCFTVAEIYTLVLPEINRWVNAALITDVPVCMRARACACVCVRCVCARAGVRVCASRRGLMRQGSASDR